ncbi:hypothetical protein [Bacillus subtilis]|uniref:hypothetical protein n=1 Tax=Bacillus subtilis TaxID=1423 RepID=UPI000A10113F|nr:hypothetical protein [Bacillus subtilis]MEC2266447.1 hypothetical protein [Bacillus subtilis]MEC4031988.1 hypothetical protein [Bacillus subtilis]MUG00813.1 hypothetical protein [Bacillus tequilensis]
MSKYAVAVDRFQKDLEVVIVNAPDEITAMVEAVGELDLWGIEDKMKPPFKTVDDGIDFYLQGDLSISRPVSI